jgi:hypothetical protein
VLHSSQRLKAARLLLGTAVITAQLSAASGLDVTVPFTINVASTAVDPDDYSITSSPIIITAGNTTADLAVTIASDVDIEGDETVIVDMGTPTNAVQSYVTTHTLTITDDDPKVTLARLLLLPNSQQQAALM